MLSNDTHYNKKIVIYLDKSIILDFILICLLIKKDLKNLENFFLFYSMLCVIINVNNYFNFLKNLFKLLNF